MTHAFARVIARARKVYDKECQEKVVKPDPAFLVDLIFHDLRHEATSRFFEGGGSMSWKWPVNGNLKVYQLREK